MTTSIPLHKLLNNFNKMRGDCQLFFGEKEDLLSEPMDKGAKGTYVPHIWKT